MSKITDLSPQMVQYLQLQYEIKKLHQLTAEKRKALKTMEPNLIQQLPTKRELDIEPRFLEKFGNCTSIRTSTTTTYEKLGKKKLEETLLGYFKTRCPEEQAIAHTAEALKFIHKSLKQKVVTSICVTYPTVSKKRKEELDEEDEEDE